MITTTAPAKSASNLPNTTHQKTKWRLPGESKGQNPLQNSEQLANLDESIFFDQALKNYGLHAFTKPELALIRHKKAKFLQEIGNSDASIELAEKAWELYREIAPVEGPIRAANLQNEHFEKIVPLWSR